MLERSNMPFDPSDGVCYYQPVRNSRNGALLGGERVRWQNEEPWYWRHSMPGYGLWS
jgi:hypothetical protein